MVGQMWTMRICTIGLLTLLVGVSSGEQKPKTAVRKDFEALKADPRLQVTLSGNMDNMKVQEIIRRLEEKTHVVIQMGSWVDGNQVAWPIFQLKNVPAWRIM